jgi:hypothetical protein
VCNKLQLLLRRLMAFIALLRMIRFGRKQPEVIQQLWVSVFAADFVMKDLSKDSFGEKTTG